MRNQPITESCCTYTNAHFGHHGDTICCPNSRYAITKLYGTPACGFNNNAIFQKEICSRFLPSTYAGHVAYHRSGLDEACQSSKMAILLNSLLFVSKIPLLPNYCVKYYDYIVLDFIFSIPANYSHTLIVIVQTLYILNFTLQSYILFIL